jgi:hypothetical protein
MVQLVSENAPDGVNSCDIRTKAWLKGHERMNNSGLIERIRKTDKPICIAVGTGHCIGSKVSLVQKFQKAGFKVSPLSEDI